jgi:anti-sigma-K factor RskA
VLGVLGPAERREAEQRLAHDSAFAEEVAAWEQRLGALADTVASEPPPDASWPRIARKVGIRARMPRRESVWRSLPFWRTFAAGSAALAAASIALLTFVVTAPPKRTAPLLASLATSSGQPGFVVTVDADDKSVVVVPTAILSSDQRAMELWLIPPGDKPHSLGLVAPGQPVRLGVPSDLAASLTADAALAVSLEPAGGSPTGQPTGPIVASGKPTML